MKIKTVECSQFAGLYDRKVDFEPGLNLVIGENESGKSTLIDLIYHLFFQKEAVSDRDREDKRFKEGYFPKSTGEYPGDTIDGAIQFETEEGRFKLSKEWSKRNGSCKLVPPDGMIVRDADRVRAILEKQLQYGGGVYSELVFASQRRGQTILSGILGDSASPSMEDLASVLTRAVMETGGIEIDEVEKELEKTVSDYESHWDFKSDMPEGGVRRGINNKWAKQVGSILNAYYRMTEAAAKRDEADQAEKQVERINEAIRIENREIADTEKTREQFSKVRSLIVEQTSNQQLLHTLEKECGKMSAALADWPVKSEKLTQAKALKAELLLSQRRAKYRAAKALRDEIAEAEAKRKELGTVRDEEVEEAERLESRILRLKAQLGGMNLALRIRQLGDAEIRVRSAVTGQPISVDAEAVTVTEAVDILIPGIAEIGLAPKGVDAARIRKELDSAEGRLSELFRGCAVNSVKDLRAKQKAADEAESALNDRRSQLEKLLENERWESLEAEAAGFPGETREPRDVETEIRKLCAGSAEAFIGRIEGEIDAYQGSYGSLKKLAEDEKAKRGRADELRKKVGNAAEVPEEFAGITDPDEYEDSLKEDLKAMKGRLGKLHEERIGAVQHLGDKTAEEYGEEYERLAEEFRRQKEEHAHWKYIREEFLRIKNEAKGNPMADIEKSFREYLSLLTDGEIALEDIRDDLKTSITSGSHRLTAEILSEGTKDTVLLAFRLAVLRHLYPEGDCVAVFDDPFTDMDPKRTARACKLLQSFAENNQVIFLTCDEKYEALMSGNTIRV